MELTTGAYGALRAGQGLLISADARPNAGAAQMDAREAHEQLQQAHELQKTLADTARKHHAHAGAKYDEKQHALPETALARPIASLAHTANGGGTGEGGGAGTVPAFGRPDLVISAPAGIALLTAQDLHAAASVVTVTGEVDVSATAGRNFSAAAGEGIGLFTYGDAKAKRKEQGDKGIRLHAAHGKVDVQAQSGELRAAADKDVHIGSTQAKVEAAAKEHVLLTAGGAYVKIAGGSIEIHAPGKVEFRAAMKVLEGAASASFALPDLPKSKLYAGRFMVQDKATKEPLAGRLYRKVRANGTTIFGQTDEFGHTQTALTPHPEDIKIVLDQNEKFHRMKTNEDDVDAWFSEQQNGESV